MIKYKVYYQKVQTNTYLVETKRTTILTYLGDGVNNCGIFYVEKGGYSEKDI